MEKIISSLMAFFLMFLAILGIRIDDKHSSQDKIISLVTSSIGEQVEFVEKTAKDNVETYKFTLPDRNNAVFYATSELVTETYSNTNASRIVEEITIDYEKAIMTNGLNIAQRSVMAITLGITDIPLLNNGNSAITVHNYSDISNLANFIYRVDALYGFKEAKPANVQHITWGTIKFDQCSFEGGTFSTSASKRLSESQIREQLVSSYIRTLKAAGKTDNLIPAEVWKQYK